MIDGVHPIKLNGVLYKLDESGEGSHYSLQGQPLRPPNSVVVQGESQSNQKFQMRSDVLVWSITDWSGGEGQIKYDPQQPNRHWRLIGVDPFTEPGKVMPGPYGEVTQNSTGAADLGKALTLVAGFNVLIGLDRDSANLHKWDGAKWGAAIACTGATVGAACTAAGSTDYIYWKERYPSQKLFRYDGTNFTLINQDVPSSNPEIGVYSLGDYLYCMEPHTGKLYEIPKSGSFPVASTLIDDPSDEGSEIVTGSGQSIIAVGDNRLYTALEQPFGTLVREIVPTSAAGTGFGSELARIPGFHAESVWYHSGVVYLIGREDDPVNRNKRSILYLQPGGEYGSLGRVRQGESVGANAHGGTQANRMLDHGFVMQRSASTLSLNRPGLFVVDALSGGVAQLGYPTAYTDTTMYFDMPIAFEGEYFMSAAETATDLETIWFREDKYEGTNSLAISPWHDFGLADTKILGSIVVHTETMPTGWTVTVSYAVDGSTSFTSAGTHTTGTKTRLVVSTDTSTKSFSSLQIKVAFTHTSGVATTRPKLLSVDVRAQVASIQRVWQLLLECMDDRSDRQGKSTTGAVKIANVEAAGATGAVVALWDGYQNRLPNVYENVDVIVDSYEINLERPGEGVAAVILREVI